MAFVENHKPCAVRCCLAVVFECCGLDAGEWQIKMIRLELELHAGKKHVVLIEMNDDCEIKLEGCISPRVETVGCKKMCQFSQ